MKKLILVLICLMPVLASQARTITVDDNGPADFDNIQDAIDNSQDGDTIIVEPGTYTENIHFNNRAVTLTSRNPDDPNIVQATVINATSNFSVSFDFGEVNDSMLVGFTITGRGIYCYGSSPTISKNIIRDCEEQGIRGENGGNIINPIIAAPVISDNTIISNGQHGIYQCHGPITNNIISQNTVGIAFSDGPIINNVISENIDRGYGRGGGLSSCDGQITGNTIEYNFAVSKGGGCYDCDGDITNNIIIGNVSGISGGGLSECRGTIRNNIIAGNKSDNGGGLFGCTDIINNTIVNNIASETGGAIAECPAYIINNVIAFNQASTVGGIYGNCLNSYNDYWSNEIGNFGGGATVGTGYIISNPLFVSNGYWDTNGTQDDSDDDFWVNGDYHLLSESGRWNPDTLKWVTDNVTSPCIDAGYPDLDWTQELWPHGKRSNMGAYGATAQASMSLSTIGNIANLNPDLDDANDWVDNIDMTLLINKWLSNEVPLAEDLNRDGTVDFADFAILLNNWQLQPPAPEAPKPNPMTWQTEPYATSTTTIAMSATIATSTDGSGVEYFFYCDTPGGHDSVWQDEPDYIDTDLSPDTEYVYRVRARNKANLLETNFSVPKSATTNQADTTPPDPNPAEWDTEPYVSSSATIRMVAERATDDSGVEYFFECTSNSAYSSNWQDSRTYEVDSLPNGTYSFVVRARDKSPNQNTTGDSTEITVDMTPPTPNPMRWEVEPYKYNGGGGTFDYRATMKAVEAEDDSGGDVQYFFLCTNRSDFSSGWQSSRTYTVILGQQSVIARFRVKARDANGNQTAYSSPEIQAN
jgi:hypothetical protein